MHLTNRDAETSDSLVSNAKAVDAGAPMENEVTADMMEAGLDVYAQMFTGVECGSIPAEEMVKAIFSAMAETSQSPVK